MPNATLLLGFIAAALVVLIISGPGVLYAVARSLSQGRRAGLVSALGLSTGALVHVAAAAVGLSAVLLTSATAFGIVKLLGASYLIYLGLKTLFARQPMVAMEAVAPHTLRRLFIDGTYVLLAGGPRHLRAPGRRPTLLARWPPIAGPDAALCLRQFVYRSGRQHGADGPTKLTHPPTGS